MRLDSSTSMGVSGLAAASGGDDELAVVRGGVEDDVDASSEIVDVLA